MNLNCLFGALQEILAKMSFENKNKKREINSLEMEQSMFRLSEVEKQTCSVTGKLPVRFPDSLISQTCGCTGQKKHVGK